MTRNNILLIMTNFNQMQEIEKFFAELLPLWPADRIIVVDDCSTDGSQNIPEKFGVHCLKHTFNQGVGAAIRTGILYARENGYSAGLLMSSNGKMDPSEIEVVLRPLLDGQADYVTGSRFLGGVRSPGLTWFRRISIPIFSFLSTLALGRRFSDITCGFRAYTLAFLFDGRCDLAQDWLNRYEMEYYIHYYACKLGLRIAEVPVTIRYSHLGPKRLSKIRPIVDWWSILRPLFFLRVGLKK